MRLARDGWEHRDWYRSCGEPISRAAEVLQAPPNRVIDVLAITSPRCQVVRNVRVTIGYIKDGTLPRDVIRATRAALRHYEETEEIRGAKTSKFAMALKGSEDAIVLDTWMAVALNVNQRIFETKWGRSVCERRIRYCAHVMGVTPAQLQAALWCGTVLNAGPDQNVPRLDSILTEEIRQCVE